jgi:hypothetical protein
MKPQPAPSQPAVSSQRSAAGAQGGRIPGAVVGLGAEVFGGFFLTAGSVSDIVVGGLGGAAPDQGSGSGGGSSAPIFATANDHQGQGASA